MRVRTQNPTQTLWLNCRFRTSLGLGASALLSSVEDNWPATTIKVSFLGLNWGNLVICRTVRPVFVLSISRPFPHLVDILESSIRFRLNRNTLVPLDPLDASSYFSKIVPTLFTRNVELVGVHRKLRCLSLFTVGNMQDSDWLTACRNCLKGTKACNLDRIVCNGFRSNILRIKRGFHFLCFCLIMSKSLHIQIFQAIILLFLSIYIFPLLLPLSSLIWLIFWFVSIIGQFICFQHSISTPSPWGWSKIYVTSELKFNARWINK